MIVLRLLGRNCPEPRSARRSAICQKVKDGREDASAHGARLL